MACLEVIGAYYDLTEPARLTWLMAGQSLTTGSFILFSGRLRHAYGHQHLLLLGFLWFSFWNMICGISVYANYFLFVFSRMMQAIGPVICLPTGMAFLAFLEAGYVSGYWKAMVFAIFVACSPSGSIMGSLSAAVFDRTWWPWTYWTLSIVLVVVSNAAKQRYQGIAASLVNTVVSYSMSFALGIAGTVEVHVDNGSLSPEDRSKGFRAGMLTGAGLARFGLCLSAVFLVKECFFESK
jgi:MFS family permease